MDKIIWISNIEKYRTSPYIEFDVWSDEEDVDLFYQIEQSYQNDDYYKRFTI